ncbi:hypothetical protein AGRA3207_000787 [Actinomadura graeca]|uniref:Uncharacterized protein n=1 Tax=Actinomadura graeca TaxID=2750812 RepID=A0ABX8QNG3_9ACTN|nr:hypothetical protein [Actinomadura graeca]QXJ20133.1 hypothetical protein AGRA3207_000787 [Actinomadura graeca]
MAAKAEIPAEWAGLGWYYGGDGLYPGEASGILGVETRTVRRWAMRGHVRGIGLEPDRVRRLHTLYAGADVRALGALLEGAWEARGPASPVTLRDVARVHVPYQMYGPVGGAVPGGGREGGRRELEEAVALVCDVYAGVLEAAGLDDARRAEIAAAAETALRRVLRRVPDGPAGSAGTDQIAGGNGAGNGGGNAGRLGRNGQR